MQFPPAILVAYSVEPTKVHVYGYANRVIDFAQEIRAEGDALFGEIALNDASFRTGPVTNESFDDSIHPFKWHHVVQERWSEVDDIVHDMDQQMHTNIKECGRKVNLKFA